MHDFCFSPLYAGLLLLGAFVGYAAGSTVSLVAGGGAAAITGLCSYVSLKYYMKSGHKKCVSTVVISLLVAAGVAGKMGKSFLADPRGHILQGFLFISSATMVLYYLWNLMFFRPKPKAALKKA